MTIPADQSEAAASTPDTDRLDTIFRGLKSVFPVTLLDGAGWDRLLDCAAMLPSSIATSVGFEHRLGEDHARADFCVGFSAKSEEDFACCLEQAYGAQAAGYALCARDLRRDESELRKYTDSSILEFDLIEPANGPIPFPGIFFAIKEEGVREGVVHRIAGWPDQAAFLQPFEVVLAALQEPGYVMNVGVMPGRPGNAIRIGLGGMKPSAILELLEALNWRGSIKEVERIIEQLRDVCWGVALAVAASANGIADRIGLEIFVKAERERFGWATIRPENWLPLIEHLERRGLCVGSKAQGLREYSGNDRAYSDNAVLRIFRGINHFKILIEDGEIIAKAYTGLSIHRAISG